MLPFSWPDNQRSGASAARLGWRVHTARVTNQSTPQSVPELLHGCWERAWIRSADGQVDDTTIVVWLQLESRMADVRVAADLADLRYRGALTECSIDDLRRLAQSDSSSGHTTCTPVEHTASGRRATAQWFNSDVGFQPVSAFPEPGLLQWGDDDDVLIEQAPSGAYTEEWIRTVGSHHPLGHWTIDDRTQLYRTGDVAVLVRDRAVPPPRLAPLTELIADLDNRDGDIRQALIDLVDCEFSVAKKTASGDFVITASTLPWRIGETVRTM